MPKQMDWEELVSLSRRGLIGKADKRAVALAILAKHEQMQAVDIPEPAATPKRGRKSKSDAVSDVGGE